MSTEAFTVDTAVKAAAEHVSSRMVGAIIFYSPYGAGAVVMVYNATKDGGTYVVDIDENGDTRSGTLVLSDSTQGRNDLTTLPGTIYRPHNSKSAERTTERRNR